MSGRRTWYWEYPSVEPEPKPLAAAPEVVADPPAARPEEPAAVQKEPAAGPEEPAAGPEPAVTVPRYVVNLDELELSEPAAVPPLPSSAQVAAALAAAALVSPAALGGIPVLPVTIDDERRRQLEEIAQESDSSVGVHQEVGEAAVALSLSQRRLAAATRDVEGTFSRSIDESDVVHAAHLVASGEVPARKRRAFKSALGRVATDSVDLFILMDDERREREAREAREAEEASDDELWDE